VLSSRTSVLRISELRLTKQRQRPSRVALVLLIGAEIFPWKITVKVALAPGKMLQARYANRSVTDIEA
jgi:hypothetical protein